MGDQVINICFHGIGTPGREMEPGEDRYWVGSAEFHAILDEIATWPSVRISFDDGNDSDVRIGLPALLERGLTADFFVLAGRFGTAGSLGPHEVRELAGHGMGVGSHGMAHRSWRSMSEPARRAELVAARSRIAEAAGRPVQAVACPLGRYDRALLGHLRELGYTRVYTSDRRHARAGSWLQPRFSVRGTDTPESLRAEVLPRPPVVRRARLLAVGAVKRLR